MEFKGSLQCSEELPAGTYHEPDESSPHSVTLIKMHFNIILLSTP